MLEKGKREKCGNRTGSRLLTARARAHARFARMAKTVPRERERTRTRRKMPMRVLCKGSPGYSTYALCVLIVCGETRVCVSARDILYRVRHTYTQGAESAFVRRMRTPTHHYGFDLFVCAACVCVHMCSTPTESRPMYVCVCVFLRMHVYSKRLSAWPARATDGKCVWLGVRGCFDSDSVRAVVRKSQRVPAPR